MLDSILEWWDELSQKNRKKVVGAAFGVVLVILVAVLVIGITSGSSKDKDKNNSEFTSSQESEFSEVIEDSEESEFGSSETEVGAEPESESEIIEKEDPQSAVDGGMTSQEGADVDISDVVEQLPTNETQELTLGIDVARYQGTINWKKVAESGVDFAMVRVGYRTLKTGEIIADTNAKYNMQEATKYGIKIGAYFFSTAVTEEEAIEEANWVADYIAKYQITYPVVYNCEGYEDAENRQYALNKTQRTDLAIAFLDKIAERGYSPMFYASKNEMQGEAKWETSRLQNKYKIWVAQYPGVPYPQTEKSSYSGKHDMWQYTNKGTVPGISKPVDMNVAYFGFKETQGPQDSEKPEDVTADIEANMKFREVNETVTAKEKTNLRDKPSQGSDAKVVYTLTNGETATRTGISDSGWSRLEFKGQTVYAVSSYLTTDLAIKQPEPEPPEEPDDGIQTVFTVVDDWVTAKDAVNLRTLPSVTNENSQVVVKITNGEVIHRIGINTDLGWSKVEYNGQILYCVSSYLTQAEQPAEAVE
ncbi:MAG: glycoside hydrolase family 25 [Agathobacter sp.]|nr:glycoside hydrolase family 25 [Agathobacter sp.]